MKVPKQELVCYYAALRLAKNASEEFITNIAKKFGGKMFPLDNILGEMSGGSGYISVTYDGGRHPEYDTNAFSQVSGFSISDKGKVIFSIEETDEYEIERIAPAEVIDIADVTKDCICFMAEMLLELVCKGSYKFSNIGDTRYLVISIDDFAKMRSITRYDLNKCYEDSELNEDFDSFEEFCDFYQPLNMIGVICDLAEIKEVEGEKQIVTWKF